MEWSERARARNTTHAHTHTHTQSLERVLGASRHRAGVERKTEESLERVSSMLEAPAFTFELFLLWCVATYQHTGTRGDAAQRLTLVRVRVCACVVCGWFVVCGPKQAEPLGKRSHNEPGGHSEASYRRVLGAVRLFARPLYEELVGIGDSARRARRAAARHIVITDHATKGAEKGRWKKGQWEFVESGPCSCSCEKAELNLAFAWNRGNRISLLAGCKINNNIATKHTSQR